MDHTCDWRLSLRHVRAVPFHRAGADVGADVRRPERQFDGLSYRRQRTLRRVNTAWRRCLAEWSHTELPNHFWLVSSYNRTGCPSLLSWTGRMNIGLDVRPR